jgi:2-polyprenyl-3-methyl-5-hydroxy-6-metoxy-1,4-benzoquinol methylase
MALDYDLESSWRRTYGLSVRSPGHRLDGQAVTYSRAYAQMMEAPERPQELTYHLRVAAALASLLRIAAADRILVAGCGFGFLVEAMAALGQPNCWGVDSSAWIESGLAEEAGGGVSVTVADFLDPSLPAIMAGVAGPGGFDWILSEHLLEAAEEAVIPSLLDSAEGLLSDGRPLAAAAHLVQVVDADRRGEPDMTWKSAQGWKALRPSHTWVASPALEIA